jgi:hypothetical protein
MSDALLAQVSALQEMGFPEAASKVAVMRYPHRKKKAVEHLLGGQILQTDEAKKWEEFPENKRAMQYRRFCENILSYLPRAEGHPRRIHAEHTLWTLLTVMSQVVASLTIEYLYNPYLLESLLPYYAHQWLDVCDADGAWIEAQVLEVADGKALIHYKGWKSKYDEWLPCTPIPRVTFYQTHTAKNVIGRRHKGNCDREILPDHAVVVLDSRNVWLRARVLQIKKPRKTSLALVTYLGWIKKYDEWIPFPSLRICACTNPWEKVTPAPRWE